MLATRVGGLGDFSGTRELLHDPVAVIALGHLLHVGPHMLIAWSNKEARPIAADLLELGRRHFQPQRTRVVCTLAKPSTYWQYETEASVHIFHTLVDIAEEHLIHCRPFAAVACLRESHPEPPTSRASPAGVR